MVSVKITDLRREVKERLTKKGIVDLSDFKLKPINVNHWNDKEIRSGLEKNLTKIGSSLLADIVNTDISEDEKIVKINKILTGDIKVEINRTDSPMVKRVVKSFNKGVELEDTYLNILLKEGSTQQHTFSTLYYKPTKKQEGFFAFKFEKTDYIPFVNFKKLVGTLYFINKLREYIKANKEMSMLVYIKYILKIGIYKDKEHRAKIEKLADEYNLLPSLYDGVYIRDFSETYRKTLLKNKRFDYLDWFDNDNFFSLDSVFNINGNMDNYHLYSIRNVTLVSHFFNHLYELNSEEEHDAKEEVNIRSEYARSYETKKNIPQKVLNKMETTVFKRHFGYIEFDELVDLNKIELIEKEWDSINNKILFPLAKEHSLRFRRLGKYNASGLYFSEMKAVCIDLAAPSSMIHEIFHMIDYTTLTTSILSSLYNFRGIVERYREITDKKVDSLDDTNKFKIKWNGKTKYNKDYYHSSKEIFARCGEIYIEKILGIESSLVKADNRILYPTDDEFLLDLIKKYYSSIIQLAPQKKEEQKIACSSKIMSKEEITNILEKYQISIFDATVMN
ncbi:hypothetical protein NE686_18325 [Tissierella carlieri]|uniref:Uncharacterized protein n=1 Tax=Tissierella carlieri TaxID=689904 RepID=A0ABT1SF80_9FIRM|nr:hypothetical protein [Tissierella carlieri]MCQ4925064.1 hypothetical protein [Tissierella carlieri]